MITQKQFEKTVNDRIKICQNGLIVKGKEYVRNDDRLHNFRETARREGKTMLEALQGMVAKHDTSYYDMIADVKAGKAIDQKKIDDLFTDRINYNLLAEAIIVEHNNSL